MKVCIVGAGNMGLAIASVLSLKEEYDVTVYTKNPFDVTQLVFDDVEKKKKYSHLDINVECNMEKAFCDAKYIICTYPAMLRKQFVKDAEPILKAGMNLVFVPGYGGAEYACVDLMQKGITIVGFQRVPYVARQHDKKNAAVLSRKNTLYIATIPKSKREEVCSDFERMLNIPCVALDEYLAVTLVPSNPLLHLTGLYNVFKDYKDGDCYSKPMMFYEEWNDDTSKLLFQYDDELQEICSKMKPLDLHEVVSLRTHYESSTPEALTKKLKSIPSLYNVVTVPLVENEGKYYPDFNSRMFIEDFPFGIAIIKYFALLTGTKTPAIDLILDFYKDKTGIEYFKSDGTKGKDFEKSGVPGMYGLNTLKKIVEFYQ